MANKESVSIIISVANSMKEIYKEQKTKIQFAKESAQLLLRQKLLFNSKDHFSICLLGSNETTDPVYENVSFIKSLDIPEIETFEKINLIEVNNNEPCGDCKLLYIIYYNISIRKY